MLPTYQQRNRRKKGGFRDASVFNCSTNTLLMWVVGFFIFTTLAPMLFLMEWGGGGGGGSGGDGGSPITGPIGGPPFEPPQQTGEYNGIRERKGVGGGGAALGAVEEPSFSSQVNKVKLQPENPVITATPFLREEKEEEELVSELEPIPIAVRDEEEEEKEAENEEEDEDEKIWLERAMNAQRHQVPTNEPHAKAINIEQEEEAEEEEEEEEEDRDRYREIAIEEDEQQLHKIKDAEDDLMEEEGMKWTFEQERERWRQQRQNEKEEEATKQAISHRHHHPSAPPLTTLTPLPLLDSKFDAETQRRQASVREGFLHAWNSYKQYAWGWDELQPLTMKGKNWFGRSGMGATILDAMDTMWLMGYTHEFNEAKQFISQLNFGKIEGTVSTFETTIRALGGLLSCYALNGDPMFLEKAEDLGVRLLKAFPTGSKMPKASVSLTTGTGSYPSWTGGNAILSEVGTIQLEFMYLAKLTRNAEFARQVSEVVDVLDDQEKPGNLYTIYLEPKTGKMKHESRVTMGALGDSWYEYLLKMWLLTNEQVPKFRRMYNEAVQGIMDYMVATSVPNQLTYIAELNSAVKKQKISKMDHLVCFAGGMFALGAYKNVDPVNREKHLELGKELTRTCHESYKRMPTGIGPEVIEFNPLRVGGKDLGSQVHDYLLRPETVESYFILWRITHDPIYREWGWEAWQAIEKHCRTATGYSGLRDVRSENPTKDNTQQSFFLAETLKYLYLLFSPDDLIPLDDWVFNTEAHPLPIWKEGLSEWKDYLGTDRLN